MALGYPNPELVDDVVRLRPWHDGDLECVREAASDPVISAGTTVPAVFSPQDGLAFIRRQQQRIEKGEGISLAIADASTDRALGSVWLAVCPQPGVMDLSYWVVPTARRQGLGSRAVRLVVAWALSGADIARVEAWVVPSNVASKRLLLSAGFTREGVLRSFFKRKLRQADAVLFSRTAENS